MISHGAGCGVQDARFTVLEAKQSGAEIPRQRKGCRMHGTWFLIPPLKGARGMFLHVA